MISPNPCHIYVGQVGYRISLLIARRIDTETGRSISHCLQQVTPFANALRRHVSFKGRVPGFCLYFEGKRRLRRLICSQVTYFKDCKCLQWYPCLGDTFQYQDPLLDIAFTHAPVRVFLVIPLSPFNLSLMHFCGLVAFRFLWRIIVINYCYSIKLSTVD